jgi:predicted nucleic acid-binding protein
MADLFVDTAGWASWADRRQPFHAQAVAALDDLGAKGGRAVTTSLVLAELTALLTRPVRMPKLAQVQLLSAIRGDSSVEVVAVDPTLET